MVMAQISSSRRIAANYSRWVGDSVTSFRQRTNSQTVKNNNKNNNSSDTSQHAIWSDALNEWPDFSYVVNGRGKLNDRQFDFKLINSLSFYFF